MHYILNNKYINQFCIFSTDLEMSFIHYKHHFNSYEEALTSETSDAILSLSIFFERQRRQSTEDGFTTTVRNRRASKFFKSIIRSLKSVQKPGEFMYSLFCLPVYNTFN